MLVVTDGKENAPPKLASISSITANTFAIGIGLPSNISTDALNALTLNHPRLPARHRRDHDRRLVPADQVLLQVLAGVSNAGIVVDPDGRLPFAPSTGSPSRSAMPTWAFDAIVLCEAPSLLEFELEAPTERSSTPGSRGRAGRSSTTSNDHLSFYRVALARSARRSRWDSRGDVADRPAADRPRAGRQAPAQRGGQRARADCPTARSCTATRTSPSTRT